MPRNAEVIRQWRILRELESRPTGTTIHQLSRFCAVTTRTIRRDLAALEEAGFPLYDEKHDGKTLWKLRARPFKALADRGFTLSELSALYFSRTLIECLSTTPFHADLARAFDKIEAVLTPRMREFLDRLPSVLAAKAAPARRPTADTGAGHEIIARILDGTLNQRQAAMTYHSFSSGRTKDYVIHPYRLVYALGGLYLVAFVPDYKQVRTFAVERIRALTLGEERFTPIEHAGDDAFSHSLGVHQGVPERVELEFLPRVAAYVKERVWHPSQVVREREDGSVILQLDVCNDWALRSWVLGFGPFVRVLVPSSLAEQILEELDEARSRYLPQLDFGE